MMLYFVNVFLLWPLCVAQISDIAQPDPFRNVTLGDSATIECHIKSEINKRVWYKYTSGNRLQLVAAFDVYYNRSILDDEFHHRYSVKFDRINSQLRISATTREDVGTYFCGVMHFNNIKFGSGTYLMLEGANMISDSVVQQPKSKSVQPGDSVTLRCSHTDLCAAEHALVTWLKDSRHSAPQMIYYPRNRICQKNESEKTMCVYSLHMRNLSSDHAGTYYCVVTSCGQTLFGNGTRINIHNEPELSPTIIALMLSNIILGIVTLILIWTLCKSRRRDTTEASDGSSEGNQTSDAVTYAAVCSAPRNLPRRLAAVKYCGDSVVYSEVRYGQQNRDVSS